MALLPCNLRYKLEVGRLGAARRTIMRKAAKTSKLKRSKRQEDPWGAGGKSGAIPRVLEA